jgi:predicted dehydrogenase
MFEVACIGTGPDPQDRSVESYAMAYRHADAYETVDDVDIVACADIVPENAAAFADTYGIDEENVFEDYEAMLAAVSPDMVSVTVPPAIHADIVIGAAESGEVDAIHCEKPMAMSWTDSAEMAATCAKRDVQLTFNHQRRFADPFVEAKEHLDDGAIGDLDRVEITWGDLYDTGSHVVDLATFFADDADTEWAIGQIDYREEDVRFGVHTENQAFAQWRYESGVMGLLSTGEGETWRDAKFTLEGTDGTIQIDVDDGPDVRVDRGGDDVEDIETDGGIHGPNLHQKAIADAVRAARGGEASQLRAENALKATAVLFGAYESARRRGRVELPPEGVDDHPLQAMVEAGDLTPE